MTTTRLRFEPLGALLHRRDRSPRDGGLVRHPGGEVQILLLGFHEFSLRGLVRRPELQILLLGFHEFSCNSMARDFLDFR